MPSPSPSIPFPSMLFDSHLSVTPLSLLRHSPVTSDQHTLTALSPLSITVTSRSTPRHSLAAACCHLPLTCRSAPGSTSPYCRWQGGASPWAPVTMYVFSPHSRTLEARVDLVEVRVDEGRRQLATGRKAVVRRAVRICQWATASFSRTAMRSSMVTGGSSESTFIQNLPSSTVTESAEGRSAHPASNVSFIALGCCFALIRSLVMAR
jgi:hypothetical protein